MTQHHSRKPEQGHGAKACLPWMRGEGCDGCPLYKCSTRKTCSDPIFPRAMQGTYRGEPVTHCVDPHTGLNVIRDALGNFLSGGKLSPKQLEHVLTSGNLGGGL